MTDPKALNKTISEGQSAMYARQLEGTIKAVKGELVVARQGLADVARVLCPDQVDVLAGKHPGSSAATLPLEELITTMKGVAQTLRLIASNSTKSQGSKEDILLDRVTELEGLLRAEKRQEDGANQADWIDMWLTHLHLDKKTSPQKSIPKYQLFMPIPRR
jgi:hypothetical protein